MTLSWCGGAQQLVTITILLHDLVPMAACNQRSFISVFKAVEVHDVIKRSEPLDPRPWPRLTTGNSSIRILFCFQSATDGRPTTILLLSDHTTLTAADWRVQLQLPPPPHAIVLPASRATPTRDGLRTVRG